MNTTPADVPFLVEDLVTEKAIIQFYGEGGVGKSTLSRCAAMAMAAGAPVWNHYLPVRPLRVFYLVAEGDAREAVIHLRRMRVHIPLNPDNLFLSDAFAGTMNVLEEAQANQLILAIAEETDDKVDVIFLDPIYPLVSGGLAEERSNAAFARYLIRLRNRFNCAIWLNHHTTRNQLTSKGDETKRAKNYYGSVWLANACTAMYSIEELENGRHLNCKKDRFTQLDANITLIYKPDSDTMAWKEQPVDATKRDKIRRYLVSRIGKSDPFNFAQLCEEVGRVSRREFEKVAEAMEQGVRRGLLSKPENVLRVIRVSDEGFEGYYRVEPGPS